MGEPDSWPNRVAGEPAGLNSLKSCGPFSLDMCEGGAIASIVLGVFLFIAVVVIVIQCCCLIR